MLPGSHPRFLRYIAGCFPENFYVDVAFAGKDEEMLVIKIATPEGVLASYETTVAQALDIVAMVDIAELLKIRVGLV